MEPRRFCQGPGTIKYAIPGAILQLCGPSSPDRPTCNPDLRQQARESPVKGRRAHSRRRPPIKEQAEGPERFKVSRLTATNRCSVVVRFYCPLLRHREMNTAALPTARQGTTRIKALLSASSAIFPKNKNPEKSSLKVVYKAPLSSVVTSLQLLRLPA